MITKEQTEQAKKVAEEVKDLMNQIVILINSAGLPAVPTDSFEDWEYGRVRYGTKPTEEQLEANPDLDDYEPIEPQELIYLQAVKDFAKQAVKGGGVEAMEKYYTSTC